MAQERAKRRREQPAEAKRQPKKRKKWHTKDKLMLDTKNYVLFGIGIFLIILGFILLAAESLTLAPLLLVLGYCVFIPLSILVGIGGEESVEEKIAESGTRTD